MFSEMALCYLYRPCAICIVDQRFRVVALPACACHGSNLPDRKRSPSSQSVLVGAPHGSLCWLMPSPPHFIPPAHGSADISMTRFSLTYSRVLVLSCTGHDGVLGEPVTGKASASKSAVYVQTAFAVLIEHGEYLVCQFPPPVYGTKSSGM